ncbi:hypothetical protein [Bradyrhizobium pachyrhizi]|uniref:hypothetical protein n=1 Tax=Bradyrhizobium pachyrhizi TaxID=280333 RepID=UPI00067CBA04|nr:hypothetical protein [Bradyrhizobium pachyrhizi]
MANKSDGQLSLDLTPPLVTVSSGQNESGNNSVFSLCAHRERREDAERARHFSEIIKLADHLQRKA